MFILNKDAVLSYEPNTLREKLAYAINGKIPFMVVQSLTKEPAEWTLSFCRLRHTNGIAIWVGNQAYGISVEGVETRLYGGVTGLSSMGLSLGHHYIHRAVQKWIAEDAITPRPKGISDYFISKRQF